MDAVSTAFAAHPRTGFLPRRQRRRASYDGPLEIGHRQTNSQPRTVEAMLRLLEVRPGDRVLDVGAGSGWTTALLAHLTGPTGSVHGVELEPALVEFGSANLAATGQPWASIRPALPGVLGLPDHAPYDRILVSAEPRTLPDELVTQLADGGRMVIPVNGTMLRVVRSTPAAAGTAGTEGVGGTEGSGGTEGGTEPAPGIEVTAHGFYRFVPLR